MNIFDTSDELALTKWQRRALLMLGAVIGGVAVNCIIRWIERRRKGGVPADTAVPPLAGKRNSAG